MTIQRVALAAHVTIAAVVAALLCLAGSIAWGEDYTLDQLPTQRNARAQIIQQLITTKQRTTDIVAAAQALETKWSLAAIDENGFGLFEGARGSNMVSIANGTPNVVCTLDVFAAGDVGKTIDIAGAGPAGAVLRAKIIAFLTSKTVTIDTNASVAVAATKTSAAGHAVWGWFPGMSWTTTPLLTGNGAAQLVYPSINLGGASFSGVIPIANGGTGQITNALARAALGPWNDAVVATSGATQRRLDARFTDTGTCVLDFMSAAQISEIKAGTGGAAAICSDAIQTAMDSGAGRLLFPNGLYLLDKPLIIKATQAQSLEFVGESRTSTILAPSAVDIKQAPKNINAMIINTANAQAFSMFKLRFYSTVAYTGQAFYALEGGCGDGTGQCAFTGHISDCYFSLASTNSGYFFGGFNNYEFSRNTFETSKSCFILAGAGISDLIFSDNAMYNCYDQFINGDTDAALKSQVSVSGLHAYGMHRGYLFSVTNAKYWNITNVTMTQDNAAPLVPNPGLFYFTGSSGINVNNFNCVADGGAVSSGIVLDTTTNSTFSNGYIKGAYQGIKILGNGATNACFANVNIYDSGLAALDITAATVSGNIIATNCDWSNSSYGSVRHSASNTSSAMFTGCRFYNAGFPSTGIGNRLMALDTTGDVVFSGCMMGRDTATAEAGYYFAANGAGTVTVIDPLWSVTAPPTGYKTGTQTVATAIGTAGTL